MQQITAPELAAWLQEPQARAQVQVLDVREPWEVEIASLPGAFTIPMGQIPERHAELDPARPLVCVCHHGMRSMQVGLFLERQGFGQVINLTGGIDAWSRLVDSSCPSY